MHTLSKRAYELPSTIEDKMREVDHLQSVLMANGYPGQLATRKENDPGWPTQQAGTERRTQGFFCVLPFVPGVWQRIGRVLKATGVRVSLKQVFTLERALTRVKDKLPRKDRAGVVRAVHFMFVCLIGLPSELHLKAP